MRMCVLVCSVILVSSTLSYAQPPRPKKNPTPKPVTLQVPDFTPVYAPAMAFVALDNRMPFTKLHPSVYDPNLCAYRYRVGTDNDDCQRFVDQALGYLYSYVWIDAARAAETATKHDPNCAMAWLTLHRAMEKWGRGDNVAALKKAQELLPKASHREQLLITAKLHEKGLMGGTPPPSQEEKKKKAGQTLDELLVIYEDDEEAWFAHGALYGGFQGTTNESVPYYKALLKINPHHPGANHELVHFYEGSRRPALGWKYAEGYMASSPGIPHAFHMQAHLAMRIGKWASTTDWSVKAIELEQRYHKLQNLKPNEDHQYSHHLETLTTSLLHDGRFSEALRIKKVCEDNGYRFNQPWLRLAIMMRDWEEAEKLLPELRKSDKTLANYYAAILYLEKGDTGKATTEIESLRQAQQTKKGDRRLELRLNEVHGRLLCMTGAGEAGVKLLFRNVEKTKDDYYHHSWGNGAYYMEQWGIGALDAGNAEAAEEAFLESLAHDAGSVRAALGMAALCARLNRSGEAKQFGDLAKRLWNKADSRDFESLRTAMEDRAKKIPSATTTAAGSE